MKVSNKKMEHMINSLEGVLELSGWAGYAAARNYRSIRMALEPYLEIKDKMIEEYGEEGQDGNVSISPTSSRWNEFFPEFEKLINAETDIEIFTVKASDCKDRLTGQLMLELEWMLDWED